jgi:hypothetical protein
MTMQNQHNLSSAVSGGGGPLNRTFLAVRVVAIGAALAGALPTAMNLYQSWTHGIPYSEVSHRLSQYDLWVKNFECKIDYRALNTSPGTRVDVGACPKSGDIAIKISAQSGKATYEWIPFDKLQKTQASLWPVEFLVGTAHAGQPGLAELAPAVTPQPRPASPFQHLAQAQTGMQVVCEALQGKTVVRVVSDAGKCFREIISPYQGKVEKREEVPCATTCKPVVK